MLQPEPAPQSPFTVGDRVRAKRKFDDLYQVRRQRSAPGTIAAIGETGAHIVDLDSGMRLPYGAHELEKVRDA